MTAKVEDSNTHTPSWYAVSTIPGMTVKVDCEEVAADVIMSIDYGDPYAQAVGEPEGTEMIRKRKKRVDSKCTHSEESFSRKWNDKLYCMECQKGSWKRARERAKEKKAEKQRIEDSINNPKEVFFSNYP